MFDVPFRRAGKNTKRYEAYFFLDEIEEIEEIPAYDPNKYLQMAGISLGFGKRLKWPDNYFYARFTSTAGVTATAQMR